MDQPTAAIAGHNAIAAEPGAVPMQTIPLEYAAIDVDRPPSSGLRVAVLLAWICVAISPIVITLVETEFLMAIGAADALLAICVCSFGGAHRARWCTLIGVAHIALAAAVFATINIRDWSPLEATAPVVVATCIAAALLAYPTWCVFSGSRR